MPRRADGNGEWLDPERMAGDCPGDTYYRVRRTHLAGFGRRSDHLVAIEPPTEARALGRGLDAIHRTVLLASFTIAFAGMRAMRRTRSGSFGQSSRLRLGAVLTADCGQGGHRCFLRLLDETSARRRGECVTVVLPAGASASGGGLGFDPALDWLKLELLLRPNVIVTSAPPARAGRDQVAFVPMDRMDRATVRALDYAYQLAEQVVAVHVGAADQDREAAPALLRSAGSLLPTSPGRRADGARESVPSRNRSAAAAGVAALSHRAQVRAGARRCRVRGAGQPGQWHPYPHHGALAGRGDHIQPAAKQSRPLGHADDPERRLP